MNIFIIIILRLLILVKWTIQSAGIVLSLFIFSSSSDVQLIAFFSLIMIILPELVMGSFIWIFRGVSSVCRTKEAQDVPILGKTALAVCFFLLYHYLLELRFVTWRFHGNTSSAFWLCFSPLLELES